MFLTARECENEAGVRPLAAITQDLAAARQRLADYYIREDLTASEEVACATLGARRLALEEEFEARFLAVTGVRWTAACGAMG